MANKKVKFELTAVDKTKAAFDKVTKGLKGVGGAAAGATKGIAGVGLAATATAGALALIVDKSFQAIDAIGKTSTQTGIATDTLQAFHLAARESGTTVEGANTALIKFARSVGDAQRGLKTQADIFKDIGVEVKNTDGSMKSFDQILEETADGIMGLGDQTARATALANLFGRQGVVLTGAIKDLSDTGLQSFIKRAKDLGIVLSENVIRRTEAFNDAVGVIKMQVGSFVNSITTAFLPVFEKMQETIAKFIQDILKESDGMEKLGVDIANGIIDGLATGIEAMGMFIDNIINMANQSKVQLAKLSNGFLSLKYTALLVMDIFGDFSKEIKAVEDAITENNIAIVFGEKETTKYGDAAKKVGDKMRSYKTSVVEVTKATDNLNNKTKETQNTLTNLQSPIDVFKDNIDNTTKTLDTLAVNSMKKFEDSIVDGLKTGKFAFEDFATYVVEQLVRVAIQQFVVSKLVDPFRGFLGGIFGEAKAVVPSADGGGYTGMGIRAGGVDGKGGFPAILHPNETVIDHTKGQAVGGATVNFNISTVDAAGFDQLLASRKGLITQIINNAMNNQGKMGIV